MEQQKKTSSCHMHIHTNTHGHVHACTCTYIYTIHTHTHTCTQEPIQCIIRKYSWFLDTLMTLWLYGLVHFRNLFWRIWEWNVIVSSICFKIFQEKIDEVSNTKWKRLLSLHGGMWVLIIPFLPFSRFQNGHNKKEKPKGEIRPCLCLVGGKWVVHCLALKFRAVVVVLAGALTLHWGCYVTFRESLVPLSLSV